MFFKYMAIALSLSFLLSCKKVGEDRYVAPKVKFEVCLSDIDKKIKKYFEGDLDNYQINSFFECVNKTLKSFVKSYKSEEFDKYRPHEVVEFVKDNFYPTINIPENLIFEFMKLKKSILGGSILSFSKKELLKLIEIVEFFKKHSIKLNPYIGIYTLKVAPSDINSNWLSIQNFNDSLVALESTAEDFTNMISKNKNDYYFVDFESFVRELRSFLNWDSSTEKNMTDTSNWVSLIKSIKIIGMSVPKNRILADQWSRVIKTSALFYSEFMQNHYFLKNKFPNSLISKNGLLQFEDFSYKIIDYLKKSLELHANKRISIGDIASLIDSLDDLKLLPGNISAEKITASFKNIVLKAFGDLNEKPNRRQKRYLDKKMISRFEKNLNEWIILQRKINKKTVDRNKNNLTTLELKDFGVKDLTKMRPLFSDNYDGIVLSYESEFEKYGLLKTSFKNLSLFNLFKRLAVMLNEAYSKDLTSSKKIFGVTSDELQEFYLDVKPIGVELGVVAPDKKAVGRRSFMEANFFMYSSDGLQYELELDGLSVKTKEVTKMSLEETVELISFLYTAGINGKKIYHEASKIPNCKSNIKDKSGYNYIKKKCVIKEFDELISNNLVNLPNLRRSLLNHFNTDAEESIERREDIINNLLQAINEDKNKDYISYGSILSFYAIFQYVEAIMTRYDKNQDGDLDKNELLNAFNKTYGSVLHILAKKHESDPAEADLFYFYDQIKDNKEKFEKLKKEIKENTKWWDYTYNWYYNLENSSTDYKSKLRNYFLFIVDKAMLPQDHWAKYMVWWGYKRLGYDEKVLSKIKVDRIQLINSLSLIIGELGSINELNETKKINK